MNYTTVEGISYVPQKATNGSAAYDLRAAESKTIAPFAFEVIPTGIMVAIPNGHAGIIANRSSNGKRGLMLTNGIGVIDSDYRGEILLSVVNLSKESITIERGERIAQFMLIPVKHVFWHWVDSLSETERGRGGFGSTGSQ